MMRDDDLFHALYHLYESSFNEGRGKGGFEEIYNNFYSLDTVMIRKINGRL